HSGKSTSLNIQLVESAIYLKEIVIVATKPKDMPQNEMAAVSARSFSVEETRRYAGGLDDPARMATAFAGVTMSSIGQNAIIIRGNAPKGVLWRIEGIEIPNPSHFAGADVAGGGFVTLLSNQVLANSDFYTGSFPSEYGNALSGVFDMNLRKGNNEKAEHTFQAGLLGIDVASEGPFSKNSKSSYLFNYRYSTLGLIEPVLPEETNTIRYQDLSFKLNFPTKAGEFSFWGVGGKDFGKKNEELVLDPLEREFEDDILDNEFGFNIGATGITHKLNLGENTLLQSSVASSINDSYWDEERLNTFDELQPEKSVRNMTGSISASTIVNHKFSRKHSIRTGILHHQHFYDLKIREAVDHQLPLNTKVDDNGWSSRWQAFHQSKFRFNDSFILNAGVHSQYFALNNQLTVEPRTSLTWNINYQKSISLGYGNHSQMEDMKIYLLQDGSGANPNKDLKFARAHHLVLSYDWLIKEDLRLKVEPYYQLLYDVPVIADSSFSMINFEQDWFFNQALENTGKGRNYGVDITFEKFFSDNFYYLVTGSVFDSEYRGGDNVWRDTRFNRHYAFNMLGGKEWKVGVQGDKLIGLNLGLNLMGGMRTSPLNETASITAQEEIFNENMAFTKSEPSIYQFDVTFTHRKNKPKYSRVWAIQIKNLFGSKDFDEYRFNYQTQAMEKNQSKVMVPSISYKIEF
ncbi:MAG: hypothetical protein O6939_06340, partial [Bacteroidetes bacterium]|nr:hypothetical protein [Bacteroidota bacterium]